MDYEIYKQVQANLTGVGDDYISRTKAMIAASDAPEETKKLCADLCKETATSLNQLAYDISKTLEACSD